MARKTLANESGIGARNHEQKEEGEGRPVHPAAGVWALLMGEAQTPQARLIVERGLVDIRNGSAVLFCQSAQCCGHEMSPKQILDDIRRWPRARMVGPPPVLPRRRRPRIEVTNTEKRAAIGRVDAGESVAAVATAVGVSRMSLYTWIRRRTALEQD